MEQETPTQKDFTQIKTMSKKSEKLVESFFLDQILDTIDQNTQRNLSFSQGNWQITKDFITNIIEVNYTSFVQMNTRKAEKRPPQTVVKLCVVKPASGFYSKLLEIFLIHQISTNELELGKEEFLEKTKEFFGPAWIPGLQSPSSCFWEVLNDEWKQIKLMKNDYFEVQK